MISQSRQILGPDWLHRDRQVQHVAILTQAGQTNGCVKLVDRDGATRKRLPGSLPDLLLVFLERRNPRQIELQRDRFIGLEFGQQPTCQRAIKSHPEPGDRVLEKRLPGLLVIAVRGGLDAGLHARDDRGHPERAADVRFRERPQLRVRELIDAAADLLDIHAARQDRHLAPVAEAAERGLPELPVEVRLRLVANRVLHHQRVDRHAAGVDKELQEVGHRVVDADFPQRDRDGRHAGHAQVG